MYKSRHNIAHVLPWSGLGGVELATLRVAELVKGDFNNVAFCLEDSPRVRELFAEKGFDTATYRGVEPSYRILPQLAVSMRFDRVVLDLYDAENSFRVLSPKLSFPLDTWGEIFLMYSHYWYGDKIQLRSGQVPLETMPDANVIKLQAQVRW